jgi:ABC-type sugar transport system substrate-binding protein
MKARSKAFRGTALGALLMMALAWQGPARAHGGAGAFLGGMVTAKVLDNMQRQTQAQEIQAYQASRPQPAVRQSAPARLSPEQQLQQLDKLAAGGYITQDEYKARRKAILDNM